MTADADGEPAPDAVRGSGPSVSMLSETLDHVSDGVLVLDSLWHIVFANEPALRLVQRRRDELVGREFWEVFPEAADHELGDSYREAMRTGQAQRLEAFYGPLQGWFDVQSVPVTGGLVLTFQNSSERREAVSSQRSLVSRLEEAVSRQNRTQSVVIALAEAMRVEDVASATLHLANASLGTMAAGIALLADDDSILQFVRLGSPGEQVETIWETVPLDEASPLTDSVRLRQPMYHSSRTELLATYPQLLQAVEEAGTQAFASVPMIVGPRILGALSLSWADERVFTEQERGYVRMLAAQCAQAIERTQLLSRQRDVAETLQQAMLPSELPTTAGVEISACYLPATRDLTVGGDWYDAFTLPDGRVVFAVGDVSGHGVQAAAVMGQIRNALRAYIVEGHGPAHALTMLDRLVDHAGHGVFATVIVAIYEPTSGDLVWASAGHPPFVRLTADGASLVEGSVGAPVGVLGPLGHRDERAIVAVGDAVIGYTDGLVERRGEDLTAGFDRLLGAVSQAPTTISAEWCERLVDATLGTAARDDDICVLVLQRT